MDGMLALTIVCVVFAIGDFISDRTHAVIPVLLFATIVFLILFWTGTVPTTLFTDAGLIPISNMMTGLFIVNMGTLLDLKQFIQQWKVVALGLAIVIVGGILMFFVSRPVLGNNYAVALVGPSRAAGSPQLSSTTRSRLSVLPTPSSWPASWQRSLLLCRASSATLWHPCSCARKLPVWSRATTTAPSSGSALSLKAKTPARPRHSPARS